MLLKIPHTNEAMGQRYRRCVHAKCHHSRSFIEFTAHAHAHLHKGIRRRANFRNERVEHTCTHSNETAYSTMRAAAAAFYNFQSKSSPSPRGDACHCAKETTGDPILLCIHTNAHQSVPFAFSLACIFSLVCVAR